MADTVAEDDERVRLLKIDIVLFGELLTSFGLEGRKPKPRVWIAIDDPVDGAVTEGALAVEENNWMTQRTLCTRGA